MSAPHDASCCAAWIRTLAQREIRPGPWTLEPITELLARLGDPHRGRPVVHVAGTRGKGSTCALVAAALSRAGHATGLTTSPHLRHPGERIRVDGAPVGDGELDELVRDVHAASAGLEPGYFEAMTAAAFLAFARRDVAVAVVEVGMGGRLDATNVVAPTVTAITRLGLDHADRLGPTRADVAREKAGIAKRGVPLVLAPNHAEAVAAVLEVARRAGAPVRLLDAADVREAPATSLPGAAQRENAAVAAAVLAELGRACPGLAVGGDVVREAFLDVRWRARLERLPEALGSSPRVDLLLDVAHDVDGAAALAAHVSELGRADAIVFSCLEKKDLAGMAGVLAATPVLAAARVVVPELPGARARPAADVVSALAANGLAAEPAADVRAALDRARAIALERTATRHRLVVAFGSFVLAGAALDVVEPLRR